MSMRSGFQKRGGFGDCDGGGGGGFRDRGDGRGLNSDQHGGFGNRGGGFCRDRSESDDEMSPFRGGRGGGFVHRDRRGGFGGGRDRSGFRGDIDSMEKRDGGGRFNRKRKADDDESSDADENDSVIDMNEMGMNGFAGDKQPKMNFDNANGKNAEDDDDEDNDDEGDDMDEDEDTDDEMDDGNVPEAEKPNMMRSGKLAIAWSTNEDDDDEENSTPQEKPSKQPVGKAASLAKSATTVAATQQNNPSKATPANAAAGNKADKQKSQQQQKATQPPQQNKQQTKSKDAAKTRSDGRTLEIDVLAAAFGPERAQAIREEMDVRFRAQKRRQLFIGNLGADITANDIRVLLPEASAVDMRRIAAVPKLKLKESFYSVLEFRTEEACRNAHSRIVKTGKMGGRDLSIDFMGEKSKNVKNSAGKDARNRYAKFVEKAVPNPLKLYVCGLGAKTKKADLKKVFPKCVHISNARKHMACGKRNRKTSTGASTFCFVFYSNPADAGRAFETTNGTQVGDSKLTVMFATAKSEQAQDILDIATGKKAPKKAPVEEKPDDAGDGAAQSGSQKRKQQNDSKTDDAATASTQTTSSSSQQQTPNKKQKIEVNTAVAAAAASNKKQQQQPKYAQQQTPNNKSKFDAVITPANTNKKQQQQKKNDTSAVSKQQKTPTKKTDSGIMSIEEEIKERLLAGGIDPSMLEADDDDCDEEEDDDDDDQTISSKASGNKVFLGTASAKKGQQSPVTHPTKENNDIDDGDEYEDNKRWAKGVRDRAVVGKLGAGDDEDDDAEDDDSLEDAEGESCDLDGIASSSSSRQQLFANDAEKPNCARMCNFDDAWDALLDETKRIREEEYAAKNKSIGPKSLMVLLNDTILVRKANGGDDAEPLIDEDTARRLHQIVWRVENPELPMRRRRPRNLLLSNKHANDVKSMSLAERVKFMLTYEKAESARRRSSPAKNGNVTCRRSPRIRETTGSKRCSALTNDPDFRTLLDLARRYVPNVGEGAGEAVLLDVLQRKQTKIEVTPKIAQQLYSFLRREKIANQKLTSGTSSRTAPGNRWRP